MIGSLIAPGAAEGNQKSRKSHPHEEKQKNFSKDDYPSKRVRRQDFRSRHEAKLAESARDTFSAKPQVIQVPKPWYMISPSVIWKVMWDWAVIVLVIYNTVFIPFNFAFDPLAFAESFDLVVDAIFAVDMVLNFFTCVERTRGTLIIDIKTVIASSMANTVSTLYISWMESEITVCIFNV